MGTGTYKMGGQVWILGLVDELPDTWGHPIHGLPPDNASPPSDPGVVWGGGAFPPFDFVVKNLGKVEVKNFREAET